VKDPLFEPIRINRMELKNRIYMPAMHMNMAQNFEVTDPLIEFYAERARGGVGLIAVGYATVDELSGMTTNIGAHRDEFIPGLRRLSEAIQRNGARSAVQINHAGRYMHSFFLDGKQPVAPSAVASRMTRETPRELETDEISHIVGHFAQAARRVQEAGYDAVEVLAGTGYLISEFLSPLTNRRTDAYGGRLENRMRFGLEVIAAIRRQVGPDFPLLVRMNGNDFMPEGNRRRDLQVFARELVSTGVDALNINVGWHEARVPQIVTSVPRGVFAYLARDMKTVVDVPVIAGHRINDPITARQLIADGMCDMVAMGRPLIADPQLPNKASSGREAEIVHCIACAQGCFDNLFKLKPVECLCNPKAGHEKEATASAAGPPKTVVVIGGGAAGMSAALAASEAGHRVTLYEAGEHLGGQLHIAGAPPGREEFAELAKDLARQVALSSTRVVLNRRVDEGLLEAERPDAVILATGAVPIKPQIPGADLPHVVQAWDVLADRVVTGRRVVIIGGGAVGVETALFLAEKGTLSGEALKFLLVNRAEPMEDLYEMAIRGTKLIVVVEMLGKLGKDIGKTTKWGILQDVSRRGVKTRTAAKALEITATGVRVEKDGSVEEIPADTVVLAIGAQSHHPLRETLENRGIACQVVGDAAGLGLAFDAVHQGYRAGRSIF
jgi:2,4-dienoyl-CoA reductase (NADPH2)